MITKDDVMWVVNEHGEFGVKIQDQVFFVYKGEPFQYTGESDSPKKYRPITRREFGESGPIIDEAVAISNVGGWEDIPLPKKEMEFDPNMPTAVQLFAVVDFNQETEEYTLAEEPYEDKQAVIDLAIKKAKSSIDHEMHVMQTIAVYRRVAPIPPPPPPVVKCILKDAYGNLADS